MGASSILWAKGRDPLHTPEGGCPVFQDLRLSPKEKRTTRIASLLAGDQKGPELKWEKGAVSGDFRAEVELEAARGLCVALVPQLHIDRPNTLLYCVHCVHCACVVKKPVQCTHERIGEESGKQRGKERAKQRGREKRREREKEIGKGKVWERGQRGEEMDGGRERRKRGGEMLRERGESWRKGRKGEEGGEKGKEGGRKGEKIAERLASAEAAELAAAKTQLQRSGLSGKPRAGPTRSPVHHSFPGSSYT